MQPALRLKERAVVDLPKATGRHDVWRDSFGRLLDMEGRDEAVEMEEVERPGAASILSGESSEAAGRVEEEACEASSWGFLEESAAKEDDGGGEGAGEVDGGWRWRCGG